MCPHRALPGPLDGNLAVRAAEMGAAIRCPRAGDFPRETETAESLTSNPEPWSPHPVSSETGMACVGFRPLSARFSPSTRERLPGQVRALAKRWCLQVDVEAVGIGPRDQRRSS